MRLTPFALLLVLPFAPGLAADKPAPKKDDPLAPARQRLQRGNYAEARAAFEELAKDAKHAPAAAAGTAAAWRAEGEYAKALDALDAGVKAAPADPDLLAERADLLYSLGRWDDALKDAAAATAKAEKHFLARWVRAQILRDKGELETADKEMRWFVREYTAASDADKDITDTPRLLVVGQAGAENARWHNLPRQFGFILNEVYGDILKRDPDCWQAEVFAGRMLLEKYNRPDALDAFDKALKINPKAADALVGKALAALQTYELKDAERFAEEALKANPKHPEGLVVRADLHLIAGDIPAALATASAAKAINPRDEAALARLAACHLLRRKQDEFAAVVKEVEAFDTKPGVFYDELASVLDDRKQYAKAEEYFRKAAELRPQLASPRTGLGMLFLRLGKEAEGRELLETAFKADPFNVRVANSLKVLRHLEKYETIETAHYVLKFDPANDKVLAGFVADYLEEVHAELKTQFGYEPPGKVLFELFSTHEMFSGRTVALPDLHTIGACTGKVVAMASPKAKGVNKPFNWGRVVRHELVHIFNLAQTDFLVPHWLTEGLAVRNEGGERPTSWSVLLRDRVGSGELLNLDTITLGFVRPKGPDEWTLAYAQSQQYVDYMTKTHGPESVGKILDAYRSGADTRAALKQVLGVEQEAFEAGYKAHLAAVVKAAGGAARKKAEKPMTADELEAAHKADPDDPDPAARLAEVYVRRGKTAEARKLAEAALAKQKGHPLAATVKARLLARAGDEEGALAVLGEAAKANPDDPKVQLALGRAFVTAKEYDKAAEAFEKGRKLAPLDGDWLEELARIYNATGRSKEMIGVLTEMVARDADELPGRVKLAQLHREAGRHAEAEAFARDALFIDVTHEDARAEYLAALRARKKDADAAKVEARFKK